MFKPKECKNKFDDWHFRYLWFVRPFENRTFHSGFQMPFENRIIHHLNYFLPFEYRTSPVFGWLLYTQPFSTVGAQNPNAWIQNKFDYQTFLKFRYWMVKRWLPFCLVFKWYLCQGRFGLRMMNSLIALSFFHE